MNGEIEWIRTDDRDNEKHFRKNKWRRDDFLSREPPKVGDEFQEGDEQKQRICRNRHLEEQRPQYSISIVCTKGRAKMNKYIINSCNRPQVSQISWEMPQRRVRIGNNHLAEQPFEHRHRPQQSEQTASWPIGGKDKAIAKNG